MTRTKKLLAAFLAAIMLLALTPAASLADAVGASVTEAKKLALLDKAWENIETVEAEAKALKASPAEITKAAYLAALNDPLVDRGSLVWESDIQFAFTVDGMHCLYYYTARAEQPDKTTGEKIVTSFAGKGECGWAQSVDVLLVGPYYSSDSSFTDQYKTESDSIAQATGGTCTKLVDSAATGPAIAQNYINKGVVIYDSHGTQSGTSSYLCLTTNSGITSTDYDNGWAVSSGSAAYIDGRYIQNHVSGALSNCLVWMAICEGMKKSGNGTTGTALLAAGAAAVYGYSQSVSFTGDYKYEATFWTEMKNGATMADALTVMKDTWGVPDPVSGGDAYPIVMSSLDPFPSNPDAAQTVYCDWTLFPQEDIDLESFEIGDLSGSTVTSSTLRQGKQTTLRILPNPSNANTYTTEWSSADTSVATVTPSANGKTVTVTGVAPGETAVTATVTNGAGTVLTKSVAVTVTEAPKWNPTDVIVPGEEYLIGFVVNGTTYLMVNYNESASNHYYYSISSNYYGYTAPAVMNGQSVIGVTGNASDIDYCVWTFSTASGGTITSGYESSRYLYTYTNTNYADLYPNTSSTTWTYSAANKTLSAQISSATRYAQYYTDGSNNLMGATSDQPSNGYVQLYSMTAEEPDPSAVYYTVTFVDWDGTVISSQQVKEGSSAIAPANPTRPGYIFNGWDTDFTNVTSDLTVTATYLEKSEKWVPTDTIVPGEEYLIGFVVDGTTYLMVNYNASATNHYYNNISSNYYGYTAPAVMNGSNIVGVTGNAEDLMYCVWKFSSEDGGTVTSGYESSRYLYTFSSTSYADLYPNTSGSMWTFSAEDKTLYTTVSSTKRYVQYYTNGSLDMMGATSSVPTNGYVQLYTQSAVTPEPTYYTVTFKDWNGDVLKTEQVEEGHSATAPADPVREGYTFIGWDVDFTNVTADLTVTALYEENSPAILAGDVDGNGVVDVNDVNLLNAYLMNCGSLDAAGLAAADVNGNGIIDAYDSTLIMMIALGLAIPTV